MISCPLCNSNYLKFVTDENSYEVLSCLNCTLHFINPLPSLEMVKEMYQVGWKDSMLKFLPTVQEFYQKSSKRSWWQVSAEGECSSLAYQSEAYRRRADFVSKKRLVSLLRRKARGSLLDIGSGPGYFLKYCAPYFEVMGVEISKEACKFIKDVQGIEVVEGFFEEVSLPDIRFDIITSWDVFEHVLDPKAFLAKCHQLLNHGGILHIRIPNGVLDLKTNTGFLCQFRFGVNSLLSLPRHVYFYSASTLRQMVQIAGFRNVEVFPKESYQGPLSLTDGFNGLLIKIMRNLYYEFSLLLYHGSLHRSNLASGLEVFAEK